MEPKALGSVSQPDRPLSGDSDRQVAAPLSAFTLTTDGIAPSERLAFWRETALRRVEPVRVFEGSRPFTGRLRRLTGKQAEFWDHRTDAIWVARTQAKCRTDGRGDISMALVLDCEDAMVDNGTELRLRHGDLYVIDYARPLLATRPTHRELALMLPRQRVHDVLGEDLSVLSRRAIPVDGIGDLLRRHMKRAADAASASTVDAQTAAVDKAVAMALAALQAARRSRVDPDQVGDGLFAAALAAIERSCADPEFDVRAVEALIGCSRTSLYRLFARHGETVSAAIWSARLQRAWTMLVTRTFDHLPLSEISLRSGFLDQSSFSRMFRQRYGVAPRDARGISASTDTWH